MEFKIQVLNSKKSEKSEVDLLEKIELEQSRNRELSRQLNLAQRDAEFYRAEADKSITLIQHFHAALASYQSPIKFDENEILPVSQIEDLTHHLVLVKSYTESYQKKIEGRDTELLKAQNYIVELQKQLKENDRKSDSRAQRQIEDLERQLEAARAELRFIEKESSYRTSTTDRNQELRYRLHGKMLTSCAITFGNAEIGNGCEGWRCVRGMPMDMICGVGQGGACFANSLMGRCSRMPWRHLHYSLG